MVLGFLCSTILKPVHHLKPIEVYMINKVINKYRFLEGQDALIKFAMELKETFDSKGFIFKKNGQEFTVGRLTTFRQETKRETRERWIIFRKRSNINPEVRDGRMDKPRSRR